MKSIVLFLAVHFTFISCHSQNNETKSKKHVGGPCQGCEAVLEYGNKKLTSTDTLPDFETTVPKLKLTGTVYKKDGKTPAEDVVLYIYHTNRDGIYPKSGNEKGWGKRHGYLQGWVKTNSSGKYTFYTFRPASYPNGNTPEHIHITVKEPNINEYYLDDFMFADDSLLTESFQEKLTERGGSGIVQPKKGNGILTVKRDIILGLNIPNYP
ncbi:intradiol ring-cleavage dioxygenase [Galbibacter sp. BG1]|uniref:intradiol ring-cleavage dioxygenase n=1 Tax=Galbibacter sp. BG1 TaxID=1170699 RepID=UPI0015BC8E7E|nr:intradiol ring-cleavage dioxygenase [Galbibacter sp. BG1]QLE02581.1 intradiol ring-cleavage dioxygenase [Galbibacter sp. BG1]